nr:universal stress protein [Kitasatospora sp. Xyl93]
MDGQSDREHRIIVGVDGSPSSVRALSWAIGMARLTGGAVDAVACWQPATMYDWMLHAKDAGHEEAAREALAGAVAEALAGTPPVPVRQTVLPGNAAEVLVEQSREADLVVVGSHGHGGFTGGLLGSTSHRCVEHAFCPVVVVRPSGTTTPPAGRPGPG